MATETELSDICGFSMGGPVLRQCIKGQCHFWHSTEKAIAQMTEDFKDEGLTETDITEEAEKIREKFGDGCCNFDLESNDLTAL